MKQIKITKEEFAKSVNRSIEKLDEILLLLAEKGYIRIFDYDKNGMEFNLNAETEQEAKKLLKKFDRHEAYIN